MRRHAESDNISLLTEVLEGQRGMAFMAVNNEQSVRPYCTALRMGVEMFQPTYP